VLPSVSEMTDSDVGERGGKRERLVSAAAELLHRQGVQATTLRQIAEAAHVPPGNVYYYFKTRDDLVRAVVDTRGQEIADALDALTRRPSPRSRLKALARTWNDQRDLIAESGCAIGSLCTELNKQDRDLGRQSTQLFKPLIEWVGNQFHEMGRSDYADLAVAYLSTVEGASLLANNLRDPEVLARQIRLLEKWIDALE
jgi:TetR/AcrR family transcriptional regulator, transcriptional repressor for nem operon